MNIIVLGSGPCNAIPRKGCRCRTCAQARRRGSKSRRMRSSILVSKKGFSLLIDCSPDFFDQVRREKIKKINAVILTHLHADAAGGLKKLDKWTRVPVPIYTERINFKKIKKANKLQLKQVSLGGNKKIGPFMVRAYRVKHGLTSGFPTVGYLIDKKLGYISDVGEIPAVNIKHFKNLKLLFLDAAMWFGTGMKGHLNVTQAVEFIKILKPKKAVLIQIGHGFPPYAEADKVIQKYAKETKVKAAIFLGFDGMKFNI